MEKFAPVREEAEQHAERRSAGKSGARKNGTEKSKESFGKNAAAMSFRVFRPPLPINVRSREGQPAEIVLQGRRGEVQKAAGPWRTSGEWWREEQWMEDEWDVEIQFADGASKRAETNNRQKLGLQRYGQKELGKNERGQKENLTEEFRRYRVYYDAVLKSWFARGLYD
jgi:hypothetical protein